MSSPRISLHLVTAETSVPDACAGAMSVEQAFRSYARYVGAIAYRLVGRDEDVDDIVQEVFLHLTKGAEQLRQPEALRGWLATVTVRVARRRLRTRKLWRLLGGGGGQGYDEVASNSANPEHKALLATVYNILDGVNVDDRIAWTLRYVEGEKLEDVAVLCGCSLATAKRRISAAQQVIDGAFGHG